MAVKQLSYKDIPQRKRQKAAAKAAVALKASLHNAITEEDKAKYRSRLEKIQKWATGDLSEPKVEEGTARKNHRVSVVETLSLKEN